MMLKVGLQLKIIFIISLSAAYFVHYLVCKMSERPMVISLKPTKALFILFLF